MKIQIAFLPFALFGISAKAQEPIASAVSYVIAAQDSGVTAKVAYLGVSKKTATFRDVAGTLEFAPSAPKDIKLDVQIDARTLDAGDSFSTDILKGEKFFDVANTPYVSFHGSSLAMTGKLTGNVGGQITARGVTKPAMLAVTFSTAPAEADGKSDISLTATTKINRTDFGMKDYIGIVGKKVDIMIKVVLKPVPPSIS